jgi:hypothetical protein
VRPSSHEFFDELVNWYPSTFTNITSFSDIIIDQSWFFLSWKQDPTIQSALTMLNEINEVFSQTEGFYDRLVNTEHPYITFQLLDLKNFGLSDDLYIKMNARGKSLTTFETFKARLEQHIDTIFQTETRELHERQVSIKDYFSHRIDTAWADLFWHYRDPKTHLFDDKIMHLIRTLATVTRNPDITGIDNVLKDLRESKVSFSFLTYQKHQCLDRSLLETLIIVLDAWCGQTEQGIKTYLSNTNYYDEKEVFNKVIRDSTKLSYEELVQFHAYCAYIVKHQNANQSNNCFDNWMRIIRNLTINTSYDRLDDFKRSIRSVNDLLNESNNILEYLSNIDVTVQGFNAQQIREEKLKAQLIRKSDEWHSRILQAERHGYFKGQIEFLFKFSGIFDFWLKNNNCDWSEEDDTSYQQKFDDYFTKASKIFSTKGLNNFGDYRWERALLSAGDYLLPIKSNLSFLDDADRDASWKRLLRGGSKGDYYETRRQYVKSIFDQIDLNVGIKESLDLIIEQANPPEEWRKLIVKKSQIIAFCEKRMIRKLSENKIYLLKKIRMSGEHAELFTYYLKIGLLSDKNLNPFYTNVNTDSEEPYVSLKIDGINITISSESDCYLLDLNSDDDFIKELINSGEISKRVNREDIKKSIDNVVNLINEQKSE